jgi:hypothetical protein
MSVKRGLGAQTGAGRLEFNYGVGRMGGGTPASHEKMGRR